MTNDRKKDCQDFLKRTGAIYWFPSLTERRYYIIRRITAVCAAVATVSVCISAAIPMAVCMILTVCSGAAGYMFLPIVLQISDDRDNEQMMPDIRKLFEYVKIQTKAGMYLTNTLAACYLSISNRRLKQALLEMNAQIVATNSIPAAIREFDEKFQNEYISQFCMIVRQSGESGRMSKMLDDMSRQITDMEKQLLRRRQNRMERKVLIITLLVFIGIILVAACQMASAFFASVSGLA